MIFEKSVIVI